MTLPRLAFAAATGAAIVAALTATYGHADEGAGPIFGGKLPEGYRDWTLISVAHEEGSLNDLRAILGNEIAVKAFRDGNKSFPEGAIIARLAWNYTPLEESKQAFGQLQSFVAGAPTNLQFMVKDSIKYASTAGWGYAQFDEGKLAAGTMVSACFTCHETVKDRDFVFTRYAP